MRCLLHATMKVAPGCRRVDEPESRSVDHRWPDARIVLSDIRAIARKPVSRVGGA
jgi:hypothetical protein